MVRGSNPGGGEIFSTRPDRPWGPPSLLYNGYRVSFPGVKRPWRGVDHPPPSSAEVKERVQLYLYSPSGPSWPVLEWTLPFTYGHKCKCCEMNVKMNNVVCNCDSIPFAVSTVLWCPNVSKHTAVCNMTRNSICIAQCLIVKHLFFYPSLLLSRPLTDNRSLL
jgi:hypothetical protein